MNPLIALLLVVSLVAVSGVAGMCWKRAQGRTRAVSGSAIRPADVGATEFGEKVTLLQFSTELCAPCHGTARLLGSLADKHDDVAHVDVDLTGRPDLAERFNVLQTPTVLVLDEAGEPRARIGGVPRPDQVRSLIAELAGDASTSIEETARVRVA